MATYISLDNLARYDANAKDRAGRLYADASAACWQKTEKAGAVTCVPAPETPLEPVVEFLFKETLPVGDKSSQNPSTISGVSSVKVGRCDANLFNVRGELVQPSSCTVAADDFLELSGTNSGSSIAYANHTVVPSFSIQSDKTYTVVVEIQSVSNCAIVFGVNSGYPQRGQLNTGNWVTYNSVGTFFRVCTDNNLYNPTCILRLTITCNANSTFSLKARISVFEGVVDSSTFEYVPYAGADYLIPFGSTFYGGTLDVASGRLTVTHRMVEPSSGTVDISDHPALLPLEYTDTYGRTVTSDGNTLSVGSSGGQIVYRLANPYTVYVDPVQIDSLPALGKTSPRVNTVYTDALNVQVGYAEHPAYTEELINNAILALGGNV